MGLKFEKKEFIYDIDIKERPLLFIDLNSQGIVDLDSTLRRFRTEFPGAYTAYMMACMDGSAFIGETFTTQEHGYDLLLAVTVHSRIGQYKDDIMEVSETYKEIVQSLEKSYKDRVIISGHLSKYMGNGIMNIYNVIKNSQLNWVVYKE
jgi:hypothetical protein